MFAKILKFNPNHDETGRFSSGDGGGKASDQTKSEAFKEWFHGSVVVDSKGNPQVMYHGTNSNFSTFDGGDHKAIYLTPSKDFANYFAEGQHKDSGDSEFDMFSNNEQGGNVMPVYVSAKKPFDAANPEHLNGLLDYLSKHNTITDEDGYKVISIPAHEPSGGKRDFRFIRQNADFFSGPDSWRFIEAKPVQSYIRSHGYDGFYINESVGKGQVRNLAVFQPNQIKSAIGNNGSFDSGNPNITKMEPLSFAKILKFNPNHDEAGRFSSGDSAASTESKAPIGFSFVSPNVGEDASMSHATAALNSPEQRQFVNTFEKVDEMLGTQGANLGVLGAWSDGAENTVMQLSSGMDPEKLVVSAAMKGFLAEQKAVITFRTGSGNAKMHSFTASTKDPKALSDSLVKHGIPYHTLVPQDGGFQVVVFNPNSSSKEGRDLSHSVTQYAKAVGSKHEYLRGSGDFLGSWDTREEGRAEYQKVIDPYLDKHPDLRPQWDSMVKGMSPRVMKFASILKRARYA